MSQNIDWQVETLQITGVPTADAEIDASALWDELIKLDPDMSRTKKGELDARGADHANGKIHLIIRPNQIQWMYASKSQHDADASGFRLIGSLDQELQVIVELGRKWFCSSQMPPLKNLVFGGILLKPAKSLSIAYEYMQELSPFLNMKKLNDPYNFEYEILRELNSKTFDNQLINRKSEWDVVRLRRSAELFARDGIEYSKFATRLDFIIATEPKGDSELPSDPKSLSDLLDELVNLGEELSQQGEISDYD